MNISPISFLTGSDDPNRRLPQLWCGAKVASALAMIMNFPSHSKAKLLLPVSESTKGEKKQVRASSFALWRPCNPPMSMWRPQRRTEAFVGDVTDGMGGRACARVQAEKAKSSRECWLLTAQILSPVFDISVECVWIIKQDKFHNFSELIERKASIYSRIQSDSCILRASLGLCSCFFATAFGAFNKK